MLMTNAGIKPLKHRKVVMYEQLSRGQKAQLHATAFYLIRSIAEKHGGTVEMDLATDAIKICVPEKERVACAKKIEEQFGAAPRILGRSGDDESSGMFPL
jgi:hypothetical protein